MPAPFIVQSAEDNSIKRVHIARYEVGMSEHFYFSVARGTIHHSFRKGDTWDVVSDESGIHFLPRDRAGTNGPAPA